MTPPPVPVGLFLCDQVIIDYHSRNPSPIGIFTGLAVEGFPSSPQRFSVFATLTNGRGSATLRLVGSRLDTGEIVYEQEYPVSFPDPLMPVNVNIRVRTIEFPEAGVYEFFLFVDDDPVAGRRLRVYEN